MPDSELRILTLLAPLRYESASLDVCPGFPFPNDATPKDGDEELALYEPTSVLAMDPQDGPRALPLLPAPYASAKGAPSPGGQDRKGDCLELERGSYGFLQGRASDEDGLRALLEQFARQAWWERFEGEGPLFVRRVFEDKRWAVQIWRRKTTNQTSQA